MWNRRANAPGRPAGMPTRPMESTADLDEQTRPSFGPPAGSGGGARRLHSESRLRKVFGGLFVRLPAAILRPFFRRYGILWRFRRQLVPFAVLGVIAGAGAIVAQTGAAGGIIIAAGLAASFGAWLFTRWWLDEGRERVYAAYVLAAAAVWLAGVATYGWDHRVAGMRMAAWLLAVGVPSGIPWWWRFRHRGPGEIPDPDKEPVPEPDPPIKRDWNKYLASQGKRFEGTRLEKVTPIAEGETAEIVLKRGEQKTSDLITNAELIASAYDKPDTQVLVEPDPKGSKSRGKLTLLHRDALADVHLWDGSTLDASTGIMAVGTFPDGSRARFRLWIPGDGAVMSMVAGGNRMGKSAFLKLLVSSVTDPERPVPVTPIFADCENNGQSLTKWKPKLRNQASGVLRSLLQLRALEEIALDRSAQFSALGWDTVTPTEEFPLLLAVLDEIPALLKDRDERVRNEALRMLEMLAQRGAKRAVALVLVTQDPGLEEIKSRVLRSQLLVGNVVSFRIGDRTNSGMLLLDVDPAKLPEYFADGTPTKGLCILKSVDGRQVPTRSDYIGDEGREVEIVEAAVETPMEARAQAIYDRVMSTPDDQILIYLGLEAAPEEKPEAAPDGEQAADATSTADQILARMADREPRTRAEVAVVVRDKTTKMSTVGYALNQLKNAGLLAQPGGEKTAYTITEAGLAKLAQKVA